MTLIYSDTSYDDDEITALRAEINQGNQRLEHYIRRARAHEREKCQTYEDLLLERRPAYPTGEQRQAIETIACLVKASASYGDHLGHPREEDRLLGQALPQGAQYNSGTRRINIYARAPLAIRTGQRLWKFSEEEIQLMREQIESLGLFITTSWVHDDGVAFVVASEVESTAL